VRAARAPAPVGESSGTPSLGKKPGSRRKGYKGQVGSASAADAAETSDGDGEFIVATEVPLDDTLEETTDSLDEYVIYEAPKEENLSEYEMDKMMGRPHPFVDPAKAMLAGEPKSSEELWWNWRRKSETEMWSRWQRRRPDVDTVSTQLVALYNDRVRCFLLGLFTYRQHSHLVEYNLHNRASHSFTALL
jgi:hypothetical protein